MSLVIGLGHRRLRGKSTVASFLTKEYGFAEMTFAYAIKEGIGKTIFGLSDQQLYGDLKEVEDPFWCMTPRKILQLGGSEMGRNVFGKDLWINVVKRRMLRNWEQPYVISDVRFHNEALAIQNWGGILVRIDRDVPSDLEKDNHVSETDLAEFDGWDVILDNNGSFADLFKQVSIIVKPMLTVAHSL